jgi:hypothetical protein
MPYVVKQDGATIAKDMGVRRTLGTGKEIQKHRTYVYNSGDLLADDDVSQVVKDKYEAGDEKVQSLIGYVSQEDYDSAGGGKSTGLLAAYQAENAGPVDEPRKVQQAITRLDFEYHDSDKAEVVQAAAANGDSESGDSVEASESADANEVGVEGGGEVDEPRKVQDAPTGNELDEDLETNTKKSKKSSVKKAGK